MNMSFYFIGFLKELQDCQLYKALMIYFLISCSTHINTITSNSSNISIITYMNKKHNISLTGTFPEINILAIFLQILLLAYIFTCTRD